MSDIDTTAIGIAAARIMDLLERDYPNATLKEALIVVEVHIADGDGEDESVYIRTPYYCTNPSRVYQAGLLNYALDVSKTGTPAEGHEFDQPEDEDEED